MGSKAWGLVCLALLLPFPPVAAADAPYPVRLDLGGTVAPANQALGVTVVGPAADLGPNLVQNPAFSQGIPPWQRTNPLGTQGVATVDDGTALLRATQPAAGGLLYVSQAIPFPGNRPFRLSYRAIDEGGSPTTLTVLLREAYANTTTLDTRFTHLAPAAWATFNWTWTPKATDARTLTVFLQATMVKGATQQVRYDDVSLTAAPQVAWSVPHGAVLESGTLTARVRFDQKGLQSVYANATEGGVRLWSAVGRFEVRNALPAARLVAPASVAINQPVVLDATESADPDAPLTLLDPAFAGLGATWRLNGLEVGGTSKATPLDDARGGVRVDVSGTAKAGTAFVYQDIRLGRLQNATLTVRVRDHGDLDGYAFLLRESNGTFRKDTAFSFPPAGDREKLLSMPWTPQLANATQLTVYLRLRMGAGKDAQVEFLQPRLHSGVTFSWSIDGRPAATGPDPTYTLLPRSPGAHVAQVTVTDSDGASAAARATLNYTDLGFTWETPPPGVVPLSPPTPLALNTIRRGEGREDQLANADFAAGKKAWTFVDREVGGGGTWTVLSEADRSFARIAAKATTAGSIYLQQDAGHLCADVPCTLSFDYRSSAGLDVLLRDYNSTDPSSPLMDVHILLPPSPGWSHVDQEWSLPPDAGRLVVYLRMRLAAGQAGSADFRAVALQPSLRIDATVSGPQARLDNGTLAVAAPGTYIVHAAVSNPYGQVGGFDRTLLAFPVAVFPTQGGLGLRAAPGVGTVRVLDGAGATVMGADLASLGAASGVPQFEAGGQTFFRLPANGTLVLAAGGAQGTFTLTELRERLPGPLLASNATLVRSGWNSFVRVRIHTPDDAVTGGTATVTEKGSPVATAAFTRDGQDLVADVPLPLDLASHQYVAHAELRDGWGGALHPESRGVAANANPVLAGGLGFLAATLLVAAAGAGYSVWRARRRP
ncbi:MAG TPA: PKD domain-containing protein [Candidatus Thermoplasmatota archaeon]|nr:PKD domain-containing protein [Candidatus Thermoplasmatota archaeon]